MFELDGGSSLNLARFGGALLSDLEEKQVMEMLAERERREAVRQATIMTATVAQLPPEIREAQKVMYVVAGAGWFLRASVVLAPDSANGFFATAIRTRGSRLMVAHPCAPVLPRMSRARTPHATVRGRWRMPTNKSILGQTWRS